MKWNEYLNENENPVNKMVWIVDIRTSDGNSYIRNVEPTLVIITSNEDLPKNKRIYYSDYHFRKVGKNGNILKQIIAPYDNTGYRSYPGASVNVFETYEEAITKYNEQIDEVIKELTIRKRELDTVIKNTFNKKIILEND
ncbi:MAG TPA: hypothetical protein GXZ90_09010 [Clostridiales bacterium]|nr:hypothetical protein [Clostridiales bacterium]